MDNTIAQKTGSGFTYSGEPFNDPDWGKSYKTSEDDRRVLGAAHAHIKLALKKLEQNPGDYNLSITTDMSHPFNAEKQKEAKDAGSKCVTCYYSMSPLTGTHLNYSYGIQLEMTEDSKTFMKKAKRDDSLSKELMAAFSGKRNANNNDKQVQDAMQEYQREVQKMAASGKIDEAKLAALEKKANSVNAKADANEKAQSLDKDYQRILMMTSYAQLIKLMVTTNDPILAPQKKVIAGMKNNPDYYYKEVQLPGCSFACIYFDKHNKADDSYFPYSENYTLLAYAGSMYDNKASLPKAWVKPFCVKLTANGSMEQLNELMAKIDFTKLGAVIN